MIGFGLLAALVARLGALGQRAGPYRRLAWLVRAGLVAAAAAAGRQRLRLDLHRDGPPAVDRLRPDAHPRRRVPQRTTGEVLTSFAASPLLYGVLAVVEVGLLLRYARAGLPDVTRRRHRPTARPAARPRLRAALPLAFALLEESAVELHDRLVPPHRRAVDRLLRAGGLRLRRRHAAARPRPRRPRAPRADQHHRPGLGRQRGVADHRRRRACSPPSPSGTPPCSPASTCRCC